MENYSSSFSPQRVTNLGSILFTELSRSEQYIKNAKQRNILALLAKGAALAVVMAAPGSGKLLKSFIFQKSDRDDWKVFNSVYLKRAIRNLARNKLIEVSDKDGVGVVKLTENGVKMVFQFGLDQISIPRSAKWDRQWRLVIYDVLDGKKSTRDKLRYYLERAGFYRLQESVYLHAFPCDREVEFLRSYLGVSAEVRLIIAQKIENDELFQKYFGVA